MGRKFILDSPWNLGFWLSLVVTLDYNRDHVFKLRVISSLSLHLSQSVPSHLEDSEPTFMAENTSDELLHLLPDRVIDCNVVSQI